MSWRNELSIILSQRRIDSDIDLNNIFDIEEKIIQPALLDIKNELEIWYGINSELRKNELRILYGESGYWFDFLISVINDEIEINAFEVDLNDNSLEPGIQPNLINSLNKIISKCDLNHELIGRMFYNAFKKMSKLYL